MIRTLFSSGSSSARLEFFLFGLFQTAMDIKFGDGGSTAYSNDNVPFVGHYLTDG